MNFLVTGGAGFIGSNYLRIMTVRYPQDTFVCLDALTYAGNLKSLDAIRDRPNFIFVKGDIRDWKLLDSLFAKTHIDIVINFAAETHVDRSIANPTIFLDTNIMGVAALLDECLKYGVKKYHQVSTDEVYGDLPLDSVEPPFTEKSPLRPSSPYSASKANADLLVQAYGRTYGLPYTISRSSNNYGPYQFPEKLIPLMIQKARRSERLPVYGDGTDTRDWLYVEDNCEAIDLIARKGSTGSIYNIASHDVRSTIAIVRTILKALGKDYSLIDHVKNRPGHDRRYAMDTAKIERELGWKPAYSFDSGIGKTIAWYSAN